VELSAVEVSQSPVEKFREYLASRPRPQRLTEQRRDLVRYIFSRHSHFDAEQLIEDLKREAAQVSRPTVYRTLKKLVDAGLLRQLDIGRRTHYEHDYGYPQHDHLHCEKCNKIIEFQHPAVAAAIDEVCRRENFQAGGHSFVIRGTCAECNRARTIKRRLDLV
jgi:Fur family transcriptional regulator, ferric uptake regulator